MYTGLLDRVVKLAAHLWQGYSSVQSLSRVQLSKTPWTAAHQASLSIINSWSLLRLMSVESVMSSNHLILCRPLLLSPSTRGTRCHDYGLSLPSSYFLFSFPFSKFYFTISEFLSTSHLKLIFRIRWSVNKYYTYKAGSLPHNRRRAPRKNTARLRESPWFSHHLGPEWMPDLTWKTSRNQVCIFKLPIFQPLLKLYKFRLVALIH